MLSRRVALRSLWRIAGVAVATASVAAGACSGDAAEPPPRADSGVDPAVATGVCPMAPPQSGETCLLPEGTTCAFACGTSIVQCSLGLWRYAGNPPPQPPCPEPEPPAPDSPCPPCWPATATCTYGSLDCSTPDASTNRALATCPNNRWKIEFSPCAKPPIDAGADVQGDADVDAD